MNYATLQCTSMLYLALLEYDSYLRYVSHWADLVRTAQHERLTVILYYCSIRYVEDESCASTTLAVAKAVFEAWHSRIRYLPKVPYLTYFSSTR